ncbi:hypothetical protein Moror_15495 [Moniliophthora roreri MCA 2997]|uniref:Uncharacterized protein n=2 Tax=Moniliophthora roreri TaxID=221103 RepID=V2WL10_MONRO|nr:hypothetical protein Moror_15495 [Moniliophthora roreri MCA 2997]
MSNATASSSSASSSGSQPSGVPSSVSTVSGEGQYGKNIMYQHGLQPNPYQLLHLFNSEQYDDQIQAAANQHNQLEPCIKSLFFLRSQRKLFKKIVDSCSLEITNQVMYACNYHIRLTGPVMVLSLFPHYPHLSMPLSADPRAMSECPGPLSFSLIDCLGQRTNGNGYPHPDINDTQSLISRLTSEPRTLKGQLATAPHETAEPSANNTLVYSDPTPNLDVKPKVELTDNAPS